MAFRSTGTQKIFQKRITPQQGIVEEELVWSEGGGFSSSGKLKVQFVRGQQKAADYVKMLNDLSLVREGRCLCGKEWIFQQDNAAIHNASITKKYFLGQKKDFLTTQRALQTSVPEKICGDWLLQRVMKEVDNTPQFLNSKTHCPIGWGCRIHRLLLCRGVRPFPTSVLYGTKQSDGEVPAMLELWGMRSTPSLPSLPGPLWPGVVAPDRALFMG